MCFCQFTRIIKTLLAHFTFVRFLVRVNTHVLCQITRIIKTLLAHFTFVRFLVRVNTHVPCQSTRFIKKLLAHFTFVRFLVRVNTHVPCQITRIIKKLLAHFTFVRFSRSCEYACALSKYQIHKNASRTHHIRTVFSFVCVRMCLVKYDGALNTFSHTSHTCPLSSSSLL